MSIAMDTMCADDCVERLETFGCEQHSRAKASYVLGKMKQQVEFWFAEPLRVESTGAVQEVLNSISERVLEGN